MQGLWKDTRKNFLKDKSNFLKKRFRKDFSKEKSLKLFQVEDLNPSRIKPLFEREIELDIEVFSIKASYKDFINFKDLKKCENCPFAENEDFRERCRTFDRLTYLKKEKTYLDYYAKNSTFFCKRDDIYIASYQYVKRLTIFRDPIDRVYKDYFTKEVINREYYFLDFDSKINLPFYSFKMKVKEIYEEIIYTSGNNDVEFVYGKPEETYKRTFYGRRKKCSCFANKLTRRKQKEYIKQLKGDINIFQEKDHKNHPYEKSVAWCIS